MPEETPQLPASPSQGGPVNEQVRQPADRIEAPSFLEKIQAQKKKILIGVGAFFGILIFAGIIFGAYKFGQRQVYPEPVEGPTPEVATPTPDFTVDWETYMNTKVGFSFKYPQTLTASECKDGLHLFESISELKASEFCETPPLGKISLEYSITPLTSGYSQSIEFEVKEEEIILGNKKAIKQTVKKIKEAPGSDYAVLVTFPKDNHYFLVSLRDKQYEDTFDLILSTFKFLEEGTLQPISIPNDWQEFTATDPDFGIKTTLSLPPGYSFRFTGSEFTIQNDADATELWDYSTSVFRKGDKVENFYEGGSRRAWYQDYLEGKFLEEKPVLFKEGKIDEVVEHPMGSQTYLELTVSGGVNYVGEIEKHFIFVQNQILHVIRPASYRANSTEAQIPKNIGLIFYSLNSSLTK